MLNGNEIKAVIYDMDGVIIDSEPLWKEAEINIFKNIGQELTEEDCEKTRGFRTDEVIQYWYNKKPWEGKTVEEVCMEVIVEMKRLIRNKGTAITGLHESLSFCKDKSLKIGLCTSSHPILIDEVIDKFEIRNYFDEIESAFTVSYGKPHPEAYLLTAEKLKTESSNCLVIEDSIYGMISAKSAKMNVVVLPDSKQFDLPQWSLADAKIRDLSEILQFNL